MCVLYIEGFLYTSMCSANGDQSGQWRSIYDLTMATHYDTIMGNDVVRDANCEITMGNDVAWDIHCDVTMCNGIAMCIYYVFSASLADIDSSHAAVRFHHFAPLPSHAHHVIRFSNTGHSGRWLSWKKLKLKLKFKMY